MYQGATKNYHYDHDFQLFANKKNIIKLLLSFQRIQSTHKMEGRWCSLPTARGGHSCPPPQNGREVMCIAYWQRWVLMLTSTKWKRGDDQCLVPEVGTHAHLHKMEERWWSLPTARGGHSCSPPQNGREVMCNMQNCTYAICVTTTKNNYYIIGIVKLLHHTL